MIDHLGFSVSDYERAKAFYAKALTPLGYSPGHGGDGGADWPRRSSRLRCRRQTGFWFGAEGAMNKPVHVAIAAKDRATVDAFYKAAMAAGGRDNGAPGIRPHYHANYYGAFVLDPDGHNIEAVCHAPE